MCKVIIVIIIIINVAMFSKNVHICIKITHFQYSCVFISEVSVKTVLKRQREAPTCAEDPPCF